MPSISVSSTTRRPKQHRPDVLAASDSYRFRGDIEETQCPYREDQGDHHRQPNGFQEFVHAISFASLDVTALLNDASGPAPPGTSPPNLRRYPRLAEKTRGICGSVTESPLPVSSVTNLLHLDSMQFAGLPCPSGPPPIPEKLLNAPIRTALDPSSHVLIHTLCLCNCVASRTRNIVLPKAKPTSR
jgi:hypothetical protein